MASAAKIKKNFIKWGAIAVGVLVLGVFGTMLIPYTGTINYGICKIYLEQSEPYPDRIRMASVYEEAGYVYIFFRRTDSFGYQSMNTLECFLGNDEAGNLFVKKVDLNGKNRKYPMEDEGRVKKFNVGIPAIIANPPDLTKPYYPIETLEDMKIW
jgi:hypothetical protein